MSECKECDTCSNAVDFGYCRGCWVDYDSVWQEEIAELKKKTLKTLLRLLSFMGVGLITLKTLAKGYRK